MNNKFYIYAILDPRKRGKFKYGKYEFDYEPFYIGKGSGNRSKQHLQEWSLKVRCFKNHKIKSIIKSGYYPMIVNIYENLLEKVAFKYELNIIEVIGRHNHKTGPLTNVTEGGEGVSGRIITDEFRNKQSKIMKEYFKENPIPNEVKNKISEVLLSRKLVRSKETKEKISKANKNRKYSEKYLKHMREIRKGPKLTHRDKFILISPLNVKHEFLGRVELEKFIKQNNLSVRKLLDSINKGIIKGGDVRKVVNGKKNNTINCVGWEIKK